MNKRIDLHIHTNCSDGFFTPKEVIDEAYKNGVSLISITDHDTVKAYTNELLNYAKEKGITIINGVEISTKLGKASVHVLGYNFDISDEEFIKALDKNRNSRHDYLLKVSKRLKEVGYELNTDKLNQIQAVTKAHIALDVIENVNNQEKLLVDFGHIPDKGEFIEKIMNAGCIAYVEKESLTPKEAANMIRKAKGKVVLAHPVAYIHENKLTYEEIVEVVKAMKPDGIEAYYLYINRNGEKINEIERWSLFANDNNLFSTVGSDFHNKDNIRPEIGFINCKLDLPQDVIEKIYTNLM